MSTENLPTEEDLPEQLRIRREKRASLLERNVEPYPVSVPRTKSLKAIREKYVGLEIDVATGGLAPLIIGVSETIDHHEPDLTLIGLRLIHERNA